MGKWSALKDKYPKLPIDADYQAKINLIHGTKYKSESMAEGKPLKEFTDSELEAFYNATRDVIEKLAEKVAIATLELEAATRLFVDRFEDAGVTSMKFDDGYTISISDEPYPTVRDRVAFRAWVKKKKMEDMLTMNYMTMSTLIKERLSGMVKEALPNGVDIYMKTKLSRRKN